jgi:hypothetical protein
MCLVNILLSNVVLYTFITLGCSHISIVGVNTYLHPKFHVGFDSSKLVLHYDFLIHVTVFPSPFCECTHYLSYYLFLI